jgi:histidinol-phosphate aminotransferase
MRGERVKRVGLRDLVRPQLREAEVYDPGPTLADLAARYRVPSLAKLNWNENLFGPIAGVEEAIQAELPNIWMYPEQAYADFRAGVAAQLGATADMVVPGHGIQALLMATMQVFLAPGDIVVTGRPTYGLYGQAARAVDARVVRVPVRPDLQLDLPAMAQAAHEAEAKMIIVCDPNNPTGQLLPEAEWHGFLSQVPPGCVVVVDEAYIDFSERGRRDLRVADVAQGAPVVLLRSFSKLYGLAGLRLGYALVHPDLAPCFDAVQEPFNVNRAALAAGQACLAHSEAVERRRREVVTARLHLEAGLVAHGYPVWPSAANFVLTALAADPNHPDSRLDDVGFVAELVRRGFVPRAGSEFGMAGHLRITVGPVPVMDRLLDAMEEARRVMVNTSV